MRFDAMNMIDELDGRITKLWMFWSVKFSTLAAGCSATVGVYEGFKAADPELVKHIPIWPIIVLVIGALFFTFSSMLARAIPQPEIRNAAPCRDDEGHMT
jgi:hypothetical protein